MDITVTNQQCTLPIEVAQLVAAVRMVVEESEYCQGSIDIAVVDDPKIHELNRQYLEHDWPTDVLSFVLEQSADLLEGQIVVSADTAIAQAEEFGWTASEELLLYVIHGALHLVGYRDKSPTDAEEMRKAETHHLASMGINRPVLSQSDQPGNRTNSGGHLAS